MTPPSVLHKALLCVLTDYLVNTTEMPGKHKRLFYTACQIFFCLFFDLGQNRWVKAKTYIQLQKYYCSIIHISTKLFPHNLHKTAFSHTLGPSCYRISFSILAVWEEPRQNILGWDLLEIRCTLKSKDTRVPNSPRLWCKPFHHYFLKLAQ